MKRGSVPVSALLVIDAQMKLLDGPTAVPSAVETTGRIAALLAAARNAGALVVHLQNDGHPGARDEPDSPGWAIHPAVEPRSDEPRLRKRGDDGFEGLTWRRCCDRRGCAASRSPAFSRRCASAPRFGQPSPAASRSSWYAAPTPPMTSRKSQRESYPELRNTHSVTSLSWPTPQLSRSSLHPNGNRSPRRVLRSPPRSVRLRARHRPRVTRMQPPTPAQRGPPGPGYQ
jgi:hypothetical protein